MYSTVTSLTVAQLRAAFASGHLSVESNFNRGPDGTTVWSPERNEAFVAAKLEGMPSQCVTFVQIVPDGQTSCNINQGKWSVLDGRCRIRALLYCNQPCSENISLTVELLAVPYSERSKIPKMFVALNNGGVPLTPGEALRVACAPEMADSEAELGQLITQTYAIILEVQTNGVARGEIAVDPHSPASVIAHSLWKIRDAIHGHGSDQGRPTLPHEHNELFGPKHRRDRDKGFASLASLIEFVASMIPVEAGDWCQISRVFGEAAQRTCALGDAASALALGCVCTNTHDDAWLPGNNVIELLLLQASPSGDESWWNYFLAYLKRCGQLPDLWVTGLVSNKAETKAPDCKARCAAAIKLAAFARRNSVAPRGRPKIFNNPPLQHRLFHGQRLYTRDPQPTYRLFHGVHLPIDTPPSKLRRSNADHGFAM